GPRKTGIIRVQTASLGEPYCCGNIVHQTVKILAVWRYTSR
ncbi:hypothetical protein ECG581_5011, partial [Escherichia coli G58-1]